MSNDNIEVYHVLPNVTDSDGHPIETGWYWHVRQTRFEKHGPFATRALAVDDGSDGMSRDKLLRELHKIRREQKRGIRRDPEAQHAEADTLLLAFIDDGAISKVFFEIEGYYA